MTLEDYIRRQEKKAESSVNKGDESDDTKAEGRETPEGGLE